MSEQKIAYEPHPVTPERKAELRSQGFKIIDAQFDPDRDLDGGSAGETDPGKMNVGELRAWLTAQGIEYDPKAPKADIQKLIPAS